MAFTGTPVITQISDSIVRITGVSLIAAAAGIIGLAGHSGAGVDVALPASFQPSNYTYAETTIAFQDSILVTTEPAAIGVATAIPISVVKTGTTPADFRATLTNTSGTASPLLEILVKLHN